MKIDFASAILPKSGILAVLVDEGAKLLTLGALADKRCNGQLSKAIKAAKFEGKRDSVLDCLAPGGGFDRILIVGIGAADSLAAKDVELLGGTIAGALQTAKAKVASIAVELPAKTKVKPEDAAALIASGASLRVYSFDSYKTKKPEKNGAIDELTILNSQAVRAKKAFEPLRAVREGVHLARNLVNEPANILFPIEFAARAKALTKSGVAVEILNAAQMKKLGMGALLGVAQGSPHEPRLVVMKWNGGKKGEKPVAFVGKGVTFDTGGISIKPAAGMEDMKGDMGGAACVTGLMLALAKRKAKVNAIGAIGIVENAIDGKAQRPGDVVKSMSGQTIAVLNTDAEGRLVLAEVRW